MNSILGNDLYEADKVTFQEVRVKKQDTLRDVLKLFAVQTGHATERLVSNCNHIPPRTPRISKLKSQILKTYEKKNLLKTKDNISIVSILEANVNKIMFL